MMPKNEDMRIQISFKNFQGSRKNLDDEFIAARKHAEFDVLLNCEANNSQ